MYKHTLQQYFRQPNSPKQNLTSREEEMGLFTFYKQQQQEQNYIRTHFANKKKSSMKNPKGKSKFKYLKLNAQPRQQQKSRDFENHKANEVFLKNINCKMQKSQQKNDMKVSDVPKKQESTNDHLEVNQNQNQASLEKNGQKETIEKIQFEIQKSTQDKFLSKSLKKIEDLLLVCNQKISKNMEKRREVTEVAKQKQDKIIKKIQVQEEVIQTTNNMALTRNNSRKVCRISLNGQGQEKTMLNTFQKSFLKKIRQNAFSVDKRQALEKQMSSSKTIENLHDQNKKYFCNLINNFYLPHNENNQAAKILRDTLKFPNLIIKNFNLKTEGNLSPLSLKYQKNDYRSVSCKRNLQSNLKQKLKDFKDSDGKTSMNDRFKFLLKKQGTKNGIFRAERLKQKQVSLKV